MNIPQELQVARLRLAKGRPYLAAAAWALSPIAKPGLGTMAVDMYWRLYYDPAAIAQWTVEMVEGVLYHEICHLLRNHAERMSEFDPELSNKAADAEINDDLIREGVCFPTRPLTPDSLGQPEGLLAEEYYEALTGLSRNEQSASERSPNEQSSNVRPSNEPSPNESSSNERQAATNSSPDRAGSGRFSDYSPSRADCKADANTEEAAPGQRGRGELLAAPAANTASDRPEPGSGRCGSCATGRLEPWEDKAPIPGQQPGVSRMQGELIRRDVAGKISEHSRSRGKVPGHLARWAEEKLNPKINWRKQLSATVRLALADTVGATDYSYRRPSRRQGQVGNGDVIFPSLRRPVPSVAVIADTSGSMADSMIAQALAEIAAILRFSGQKEGVSVIAVDQTVQFCQKVFRPEQIRLAGGGGTDMGAGLKAAAQLKPLPQIAVVITDGYTSWPDQAPNGMKIIVVLSGEGSAPAWANVIKIS